MGKVVVRGVPVTGRAHFGDLVETLPTMTRPEPPAGPKIELGGSPAGPPASRDEPPAEPKKATEEPVSNRISLEPEGPTSPVMGMAFRGSRTALRRGVGQDGAGLEVGPGYRQVRSPS